MSKLNIDQKTILDLFSEKRSDFLIPDYQRPYAWADSECQTLWEDIFTFAFPQDNCDAFDDNDEYFLGPIVTFSNSNGKLEIIDGQQRLTTLMLLLRAFYEKFANMKDSNSIRTRELISTCLWKTDAFGVPDKNKLKINSEVANENDKSEFLHILTSGDAPKEMKSNYANNYRYFQERINKFLNDYPSYFAYLPIRVLRNCILLPIEAESQDTALRIFSTLNDRGKPLADADIFKAKLYKYYSDKNEKDSFIQRWKSLEEICNKTFPKQNSTPMDEIFTRYMYYLRAKAGIKNSTTEALRKFYERDNYAILKNDETLNDLEELAGFWNSVVNQDEERFSQRVLRRFFVLDYAPNSMWTFFVSVYFMQNKDVNGSLDDEAFYSILTKITGFILAYALIYPGVNALRTPFYPEMINVVENRQVTFEGFKFDEAKYRNVYNSYNFLNGRPITKSMITWWAFQNENQPLLDLFTPLEIEHIYARNRAKSEDSISDIKNIELLGNKSLLEKRINIRASDYRFKDKQKYYIGYSTKKGDYKEGSRIQELRSIATNKNDFTESDILVRDKQILDAFVDFLKDNDLIA